jgi:hypothetical protein
MFIDFPKFSPKNTGPKIIPYKVLGLIEVESTRDRMVFPRIEDQKISKEIGEILHGSGFLSSGHETNSASLNMNGQETNGKIFSQQVQNDLSIIAYIEYAKIEPLPLDLIEKIKPELVKVYNRYFIQPEFEKKFSTLQSLGLADSNCVEAHNLILRAVEITKNYLAKKGFEDLYFSIINQEK